MNAMIAQAVRFTQTYQRYQDAPIAIREAMCLKAQYPGVLDGIQEGDLFAGRIAPGRIIYVGPIWWFGHPEYTPQKPAEGKQGGYCFDFSAIYKLACSDEEKQALEELASFWRKACSITKFRESLDGDIRRFCAENGQLPGGSVGFLFACDTDRLLKKGIPGLIADVEKGLAAAGGPDSRSFWEGLRIALDVMLDVCAHYQKQALALAALADSSNSLRLQKIARNLEAIRSRPPQTLAEAMQLLWMYLLLASGKHIENWRIDVALGDFYAHDTDSGEITEEEALALIESYWRLVNETGERTVCRLIMGGKGRRNAKNADRFAHAALEATARLRLVTPQVSVRLYDGLDPALFEKSFEAVARHSTFPTLYNDERILPGIMEVFDVDQTEAASYHPLGCGEYMLGGTSPSLLDVSWNVPKTVEAALHGGFDSDGAVIGPATGRPETFDTFEKLYGAVLVQIRATAEVSAKYYAHLVRTMRTECAFLYQSLLTDDCLARGKAFFDGGLRYVGGCAMGHGITNAADALTAIKKVVYEERRISLADLVDVLDASFEGREDVRRTLLAAPKYGNDDPDADGMVQRLWRDINEAARQAGGQNGLDFHNVSSVNPGGYHLGSITGATADGRQKGQPFAIGNSPTAGFDKNGLTALMNSVCAPGASNGGAITNFKLSREMLDGEREKCQALFKAYFQKGGIQANIAVVSKEDLEAALVEPEKYPHVLVRLGGWTARFIDLERGIQEEILRRIMY